MLTKYSSKAEGGDSNKRKLQELFIYLLFLTVATITTMSARGTEMFYFNDKINKLFLQRSSDKKDVFSLEFSDLVTFPDWWEYVESTFIEGIEQFNKNITLYDWNIGGDILLGAPRLRQIRVKNESCNTPGTFKNDFTTCYGQYSESNEFTSEYLGKNYYDESQLNSYPLWGSLAKYSGGGYIQKLTNNKAENEKILSHLRELVWIDSGTRVVFLEFSIFNTNVNLFCSAKLIAEIPAAGGIITSSQLQSLSHLPIWNDGEFFQKICFALFVALIVYFTFVKIRCLITSGFFLSTVSFFNLCNFFVISVSYFSIGYIIWHIFHVKSLLKTFSRNKEDYLCLDIVCYWNLLFLDAMGICVFLTWVQLFKYIKFNKTMLQFSTTLRKCAKDIFGFSIMFAIILIAYSYLSILVFGSSLSAYRDFFSAFLSLLRMVLGDFDYDRLEETSGILGPLFFLTFILIVFLILLNMFLAIINETYTEVKSYVNTDEDTQLEEYVKTLLFKCRQFVLPSRKNITSEQKSIARANKSDSFNENKVLKVKLNDSMKNSFQSRKEALESVFEIFPNQNEDDLLTERVGLVERKIENLIERLDLIIKPKKSRMNASNRSL